MYQLADFHQQINVIKVTPIFWNDGYDVLARHARSERDGKDWLIDAYSPGFCTKRLT